MCVSIGSMVVSLGRCLVIGAVPLFLSSLFDRYLLEYLNHSGPGARIR